MPLEMRMTFLQCHLKAPALQTLEVFMFVHFYLQLCRPY
jgi:hypothetical protein